MSDLNPFDPPDPDPEAMVRRGRVRPVYITPPLDPTERVRQGFQQLRIDDRRMDSPMNWLAQGNVLPSPFEPVTSKYETPKDYDLVGTYPREELPSVRDLYKPLAVALGIRHVALPGEPYSKERKVSKAEVR